MAYWHVTRQPSTRTWQTTASTSMIRSEPSGACPSFDTKRSDVGTACDRCRMSERDMRRSRGYCTDEDDGLYRPSDNDIGSNDIRGETSSLMTRRMCRFRIRLMPQAKRRVLYVSPNSLSSSYAGNSRTATRAHGWPQVNPKITTRLGPKLSRVPYSMSRLLSGLNGWNPIGNILTARKRLSTPRKRSCGSARRLPPTQDHSDIEMEYVFNVGSCCWPTGWQL